MKGRGECGVLEGHTTAKGLAGHYIRVANILSFRRWGVGVVLWFWRGDEKAGLGWG